MSQSRAEKRRAAREKQWEPHDPTKHQSLPTLGEQLARHTATCYVCKSGRVADVGCDWLDKFFNKHNAELKEVLGIGEGQQAYVEDGNIYRVTEEGEYETLYKDGKAVSL